MNDEIKKMSALAYQALEHSYSPYSNYRVGCCLLADNGKMYAGCNIESSSYSLTLCAETSALGTMVSDGGKRIEKIVIVNHLKTACSPCGACRQRLGEFAHADTRFYLCNEQNILEEHTLSELLPHSFNADTMKEKS